MPCLHPIVIKNKRYTSFHKFCTETSGYGFEDYNKFMIQTYGTLHPKDEYLSVPCGHCLECRKRKAREWRVRLLWEHTRHRNGIFITLSISPKYYDEVLSCPPKYIRKYLDLLRKYTNKGKYLKHWFITEYGSDAEYIDDNGNHRKGTARLHFHGIIWDVSRDDVPFKMLHKKWRYGNVWIGWCNACTVNYVSKYILKHKEAIDDRKQWIICSNGIGENYITNSRRAFHTAGNYENAFILYSPDMRHRYPMSAYYKNKLFSIHDKIAMYFLLKPPESWYFQGVTYYDEIEYCKVLNRAYKSSLARKLSKKVEIKHFDNWDLYNSPIPAEFLIFLKNREKLICLGLMSLACLLLIFGRIIWICVLTY